MARSHPPSVITSARHVLQRECALKPGERILVAVSGGIDSMCLLHVLCRLRETLGFALLAHGVDHGLRPEAARELDLAQRFAERLGVPFARSAVSLPPGGNLQHRARQLRYAALEQAARQQGGVRIATAHHADDRAETVLLRMLRGAGPNGLAVLPACAGQRIRPLLRVGRAEIARHVARHGIEFCTDPSNTDRRYLRSQVRHELLPLLQRLSPGIVAHLNALADALLAEGDAVAVPRGDPGPLGRAQLQALQAAVQEARRGGSAATRIRLSDRLELRVEATGPLRPRPGTRAPGQRPGRENRQKP